MGTAVNHIFPKKILHNCPITSVSKKPGQTIVLYHCCGLSRVFFETNVNRLNHTTFLYISTKIRAGTMYRASIQEFYTNQLFVWGTCHSESQTQLESIGIKPSEVSCSSKKYVIGRELLFGSRIHTTGSRIKKAVGDICKCK